MLHVRQHAGAGAELVGLDARLLQHPHEQVREQHVVLAVVGQVALVLEAAAGQEDRQVRVVVRRRVAEVAQEQDRRSVE